MVSAAQARFQCRHREKRLHQLGLNVAQGQWAAETGSIRRRVAVQTLLVEHHRNARRLFSRKNFWMAFVSSAMPERLAAAGIARSGRLSSRRPSRNDFLRLLEF